MSNEIKRFAPEQVGRFLVMTEDKNGDYVNYEDYLLLLGKHNAVMRDLTSLQMVPKSEHDKLLEKNEKLKQLEDALRNVLAITTDSTGVAGYHLNGEVVAWDEFEEIEVAQSLLEANVGKIQYPEAE
ncbi:hypothetical protein ACOW85_001698 [Vibrio parahaemolyticus]|nr:hypothetical protein [Vibrio parahaemolyticus]